MELANVIIKVNQFGSTVPRTHVSPAELMFIVADHHALAGGDPVLQLKIVDPTEDEKPLKKLQGELEAAEVKLADLENIELTDEIRERREKKIRGIVKLKQDQIQDILNARRRRNFSPAMEREYLRSRFGAKRVNHLFPGAIPQFPTSFEEARAAGVGSELPTERL